MGEKYMCKKGFWVKSLCVKNIGEHRDRWDAGFRSPFSGSFVHLISFGWIMHFSYICFPCAPTLGEPRCEEHHCRGPKGFQQTRTCAAPVIGEQQLDPSASGPLRRQEALSSVGQRTILHSSAKVSGCHAMTQCVMFI